MEPRYGDGKREKIERVEEKILRWILGVDWRTPWYMITEEMQRDKLKGRAARRAWNFEKKLEEGKGGGLTRKCLEEIKKNLVKNSDVGIGEGKKGVLQRERVRDREVSIKKGK